MSKKLSTAINDTSIPTEASAPGDYVAAVRDVTGTPEDVALDIGQELADIDTALNDKAGLSDTITDIDIFVLTSSFTGGGLITSNLARFTGDGFVKKGDGVSEASGVFTFPRTGVWRITASVHVRSDNFAERRGRMDIQNTLNNGSDWGDMREIYASAFDSGTNTDAQATGAVIFNVTDIAQRKVRFNTSVANSNSQVMSFGSNVINTGFIFERIGEAIDES